MRDEFVLVKSEDELRSGMCVELRPCVRCGKRDRRILMGRIGREKAERPDGTIAYAVLFYVAQMCPRPADVYDDRCGFSVAISERRLFRLRDDDTAADETATTKRKEQVR